jgi:AcrR family transcriptional regulator
MPALAEHLDVGVTSLYWYFRKKEDLLVAMTTVAAQTLVRRLPLPDPAMSWQEAMYEQFRAERNIHREDAVLSDLLLARTFAYTRETTQLLFEREEAAIRRLVDAGFAPEVAFRAHNAASVFNRGIILHERILRLSNAPTLTAGNQRKIADWSTMPLLAGLVDTYPLAGTTDEDFDFGMRRLVGGLEQLLAQQGEKRSRASSTRRAPTRTRGTAAR